MRHDPHKITPLIDRQIAAGKLFHSHPTISAEMVRKLMRNHSVYLRGERVLNEKGFKEALREAGVMVQDAARQDAGN